jgi:hypothetical protein
VREAGRPEARAEAFPNHKCTKMVGTERDISTFMKVN